jgi:hypothetical protein
MGNKKSLDSFIKEHNSTFGIVLGIHSPLHDTIPQEDEDDKNYEKYKIKVLIDNTILWFPANILIEEMEFELTKKL